MVYSSGKGLNGPCRALPEAPVRLPARGRLELVSRLASLKATLAGDLLRRLVFVSGHRLNGGGRRAIDD